MGCAADPVPGGIPSRVTLRRFFVVPSARCCVSPGYTGIGPAGGRAPVACDRSQSWKTLCPYIGIPSSCAAVGTRGTPRIVCNFRQVSDKEKGLRVVWYRLLAQAVAVKGDGRAE